MMNNKIKGGTYAAISAISYGFNPLCALYLYQDHFTPGSMLFYRFAFASVFLALFVAIQRKNFKVERRELPTLIMLGFIFAVSSITYFLSFELLGAGIAATLVFAYPVMTAIIMATCFKEKLAVHTILAIVLTVLGIVSLYDKGDGGTISTLGVVIVLASALAYAIYIVTVNRSSLMMSSIKLTFYASLFCWFFVAAYTLGTEGHIQPLVNAREWIFSALLGLVPTVMSLVFMAMAIKEIGSTPTAIMGALEPVTAVIIGAVCFGEAITSQLLVGVALILIAVLLVIAGGSIPKPKFVVKVTDMGKKLIKNRWIWK